MTKRSFPVWPWALLAGLVTVGGLISVLLVLPLLTGGGSVGPRVGLIELSGEISDEGGRSLLGGATTAGGRDFVSSVEAARKDDNVKAVVVRINSPGGSPSASQEMYQALRRLSKEKPVVCSMGDVAASGGYYVASACDVIYADDSTTTGSIGVIASGMNYHDLAARYGVQDDTVKSARLKGGANPLAPIDPLDRALRKKIIDNVYNQFVRDVLAGRSLATKGKLTRAKLIPLANGSVYTGEQAKTNLLIDQLGGLYDAVQEAARRGNVKGGTDGVPPVGTVSGSSLGIMSHSDLAALSEGVGEAMGRGLTRGAATQVRSEVQSGGAAGRVELLAR